MSPVRGDGRRDVLLCQPEQLAAHGLLILAAFIEAYWSSIIWMPSYVKFSVGGALWLAIGFWLWRGGRGAADAA